MDFEIRKVRSAQGPRKLYAERAECAYRNLFDGLKGKRPKVGAPRFKSRKDNRQSIRFTVNAGWKIIPGVKLRLPKIGDVQVKWFLTLPLTLSTMTAVNDAAGRYFASFVVETDTNEVLPTVAPEIGIDLGLPHFAILSDGTKIGQPPLLRRAEKMLKRERQRLSRKTKGSSNRTKARLKVAHAHARVADRRRDFHHQLSIKLIRENQTVAVEDLVVKGLACRRMAKSVHDVGWSAFTVMLECTVTRYGAHLRANEPVRADISGVLAVRRQGRPQAPACPRLGVRTLRGRP
ncbi:transposase [Streptomyces sp. NPDC093982]|uniref:RNA-guided endonuclease InsQ/TnpB family protein n=1 Tax=Streptomyces sp. NPDC093982 TaxID=3155077 RepID=UPI00341FEAE3